MLEQLKDNIIKYCRSEEKSSVRLEQILEATNSLTLEEKIGMANLLVLVNETSDILAESYKAVNLNDGVLMEHLTMINSVKKGMEELNYSDSEHYDKVVEMSAHLDSVEKLRDTDQYAYAKAVETFEQVLESMDKKIVLEGANIEWTEELALETAMLRTQAEFDLAFTHFAMGPENEDFLLEHATQMIRLSNSYDRLLLQKYDVTLEAEEPHHNEVKKGGVVVSSSKSGGAKQAALKVDDASRKAANKIRGKSSDAKRVGVIAAKAGGKFTGLLGNTVNKLDKMNKDERTEAILAGGMRKRVSNLMRNAILVGSAAAINPLLGLITLLTTSALRKKSDDRLMREIVSDYEGELKVVKEKIRDAESAGDRKKKYELMRIETHLEQNIERIKNPGIRRNKPKLKKG